MKKLLILLLLILPFTLIAQETVILDTPFEREITLGIPKDKKEMADLLVQVSELYWGERYDLEKKLEDEDKLLVRIEELKKTLNESNNTIESLKTSLKNTQDLLEQRMKPDPFGWGINLNGGAIFYDGNTLLTITGNPYIQLFEVVNIGVVLGWPLQISAEIGIHF